MSEFRDKAPVRDLGDPATDPPGTVRVYVEPEESDDQHARLFDHEAMRVIKTSGGYWIIFGGDDYDVGEPRYDDDVRTWPVVPAYAVSAPWTRAADQPAPATTAHERGDLDVQAFRG